MMHSKSKCKNRLQKKMRGWAFTSMILLIVVCWIPLIAAGKDTEGKKKLGIVSAWTSPNFGNWGVEQYVELINNKAKTVELEFKGGAEVVPPLEGFRYVSKGMVSLYNSTPAYYTGILPQGLAMFNIHASMKALRESGFWAVFDEMHRKKGVIALGSLWRGGVFGLYLNKRIDKADLHGLRLRTIPLYDPFLKKIGAATVTLPPGEIYTALQKGVVDGFMFAYGPGFIDQSWNEVVKYVVYPPIPYENSATLLTSVKEWEALPEASRKEIMDLLLEIEPKVYEYYSVEAPKVMKSAIEKGLVEEIRLAPEEAEKMVKIAKEAFWEDYLKRNPKYGPKLKELGEKAENIQLEMERSRK